MWKCFYLGYFFYLLIFSPYFYLFLNIFYMLYDMDSHTPFHNILCMVVLYAFIHGMS